MTTRRTGAVLAAALIGVSLVLALTYILSLPRGIRQARHVGTQRPADEATVLQARQEQLFRDIEHGDRLATQLIAGTLSLADAVAELEPHLRTRPGFGTVCEHYYHVSSVHLGTARYLIEKVQHLLEDDLAQEADVTARLEAEYAALPSTCVR